MAVQAAVVNQPDVLAVVLRVDVLTHHADVLRLDLHVVANPHHHVVVADAACWAKCSAADA